MKKESKELKIGKCTIGGNQAIAVQSMLTCDPLDIHEAIAQIKELETAGCDIVRVAVPSMESAQKIAFLKTHTALPLVADIHFNADLAIEAIRQGADKIRLNPSNIREERKIQEVVTCALDYKIPIRVGANEGSLKSTERSNKSVVAALFEAVCREVSLLEKYNFNDIVLSAKASDILINQEINRKLSSHFDYPIHLGLTEAGLPCQGIVKTTIGISPLLLEGIGNTLRFSLTGSLVEEVYAARALLRYLGLEESVEVIACPTCGRCRWDVSSAAKRVMDAVSRIKLKASVAVMGCEVNGPGEASHADFALAGSGKQVLLFKHGQRMASGKEEEMLKLLLELLHHWQAEDPAR